MILYLFVFVNELCCNLHYRRILGVLQELKDWAVVTVLWGMLMQKWAGFVIYVQLSLDLDPDQHCLSHRAMTFSPQLIPVKGSAGIPPFSLPSEHFWQVSSAAACQIF